MNITTISLLHGLEYTIAIVITLTTGIGLLSYFTNHAEEVKASK